MKVLYITWESFAGDDVREELLRRGYQVDEYSVNRKENTDSNQRLEQELIGRVTEGKYDRSEERRVGKECG